MRKHLFILLSGFGLLTTFKAAADLGTGAQSKNQESDSLKLPSDSYSDTSANKEALEGSKSILKLSDRLGNYPEVEGTKAPKDLGNLSTISDEIDPE